MVNSWRDQMDNEKSAKILFHESIIYKSKFPMDQTIVQVTTNEEIEEYILFVATHFSTKKNWFFLMIDSGCTKCITYERSLLKELIPMKNKKELGMVIVFLQKEKGLLQLKQV